MKPKHSCIIQSRILIEHVYTPPEREEITNRLTTSLQSRDGLKSSMKEVQADYNAKIKAEDSVIGECTVKLTSGKETVPTNVVTELNRKTAMKRHYEQVPGSPGKKGKFIREEKMTASDFDHLPLPELPPAKESTEQAPVKKGRKSKADKEAEAKALEDDLKKNQIAAEGENPVPE